MKRSNAFLWLILILISGFVYWLIATGRLHSMASLFVEGYWNFLENIMHIRVHG